jgi:hypothetical protein
LSQWRVSPPHRHLKVALLCNCHSPIASDQSTTWTELIGHAQLRYFVDDDGHFWLEQNAAKKTKWAKLPRDGHDVAWGFCGRGGSYTGRMLIDGELYIPSEATKKFSKREG